MIRQFKVKDGDQLLSVGNELPRLFRQRAGQRLR
jgi:hypothetical protein